MTISSNSVSGRRLLAAFLTLTAAGFFQSAVAQTDSFAVTDSWASLPGSAAGQPAAVVEPREFDRTEIDPDFRLGPGDVLLVNVLEDPTLDTEVLVRPDGLITVPLAGTVMAAGKTPEEVAAAVRQQLAPNFVEPPSVSIVLRGLAQGAAAEELLTIYILGQVNGPGPRAIPEPVNILQALALAGGTTIFADLEEIQVRKIDEDGLESIVLVNYEAIEKGAVIPTILVDDGDTILVTERGLFDF